MNVKYKNLLKSQVGSDHSSNWATTTAQFRQFNLAEKMFVQMNYYQLLQVQEAGAHWAMVRNIGSEQKSGMHSGKNRKNCGSNWNTMEKVFAWELFVGS